MASAAIDSASSFVGRTMKFNTDKPDSAWKPAAYFAGGGSLTPRSVHNMVIMPDGKVIAIGGLRGSSHVTAVATQRPQIWTPPDSENAMGSWTDSTQLAEQEHVRDYHSTAILLPDGRILSAGGEHHDYYADLYSPPYLFNGDAPATRPTLIAATGRWRYDKDVTFAVSGDTTIRNACLIRAPSTTHQFDQSQRYVPLTLLSSSVRGDGVRQYFLKAPPDSFVAPPGDYLLFASDAAGVPSVAQWVRVGSTYAGQFDTTASDTLRMTVEFVSNTKIYLDWIAPGDDGSSRTALDYDIRYATSAIDNSNFSSKTRLGGLPIPLLVGTVQHGDSLTGLYPCTRYYFCAKTRDRAENWSGIGRVSIQTSTPCEIDPDDGSMRRARDEEASSPQTELAGTGLDRVRKFAVPASLTSGSTVRLVATYSKGEESLWTIRYQDLQGESAVLETTASQLVVQEPLTPGGWSDRTALSMSSGNLGVRSLLRGGRVVFPAGTTLESVETAPLSFLCTSATHSRLGDLLATSSALDSVSIEAATGDSLMLTFTPDSASTAGDDCFFKVLIPGSAERSRIHAQPRVPTSSERPTEFALHSAHPNPFSNATSLRFDLPRASDVRIEVFDIQGRRVATLTNGMAEAGRHAVTWDGLTEHGGRAAAGVYLCRMKAGDFTAQKRISLLP